jgi:hypothetical protein
MGAVPGATHRPLPNGTKTFVNPVTPPIAIPGRGHLGE